MRKEDRIRRSLPSLNPEKIDRIKRPLPNLNLEIDCGPLSDNPRKVSTVHGERKNHPQVRQPLPNLNPYEIRQTLSNLNLKKIDRIRQPLPNLNP